MMKTKEKISNKAKTFFLVIEKRDEETTKASPVQGEVARQSRDGRVDI